jgi:hypothetical protein
MSLALKQIILIVIFYLSGFRYKLNRICNLCGNLNVLRM